MNVELLNISNKQKDISNSEIYHNAYVANNSEGVRLNVSPSRTGDNFITALGILTETELPTFKTSIVHTDVATDTEGIDIHCSDKVKITATAENITKKESNVTALTDTQVQLSFDSSLSVDWSSLTLIFKNVTKNGDVTEFSFTDFSEASSLEDLNSEKKSNFYYIDTISNILTINFGIDEVLYQTENDKNSNMGLDKKLYNNAGDSLEVSVIAATDEIVKNPINNTIKVSGGDAVNNNELILPISPKIYSTSMDTFATYSRKFLLNIRQVIDTPNQNLIVPETGFGTIISKDTAEETLANFSIKIPSSKETDLAYETYTIRRPENDVLIVYDAIIPQYYSLVGYVVSDINIEHAITNVTSKAAIDFTEQNQAWITVYLKPITDNPSFYSWNYNLDKPYTVTE